MKSNFLVAVSCIMLISISTLAYGAEGPYVSINLGPAVTPDMDISEPSLNSYLQVLKSNWKQGLPRQPQLDMMLISSDMN